jgi:hypothetical protein
MRFARCDLTPVRGFFLAALVGSLAVGACSLNTQPIPPGDNAADGGSDFGGSGGLGATDASTGQPLDGGVTTNPVPGDDAGDASSDASNEDASDAGIDAGDADTDAADD